MQATSALETPADTYHILAAKGEANSKLTVAKTFHASVMGGIQVGIGGLLCLTVCGNMAGVAATNPGLVKFVFGALFPVCLVLVLNSGTQLYTGNTATMASAYWEGKIGVADVLKSWVISFLGNVVGCGAMAWVGAYTGIISGGGKAMAAAVGVAKCGHSLSFGQMVVKGIFCNYLVRESSAKTSQMRRVLERLSQVTAEEATRKQAALRRVWDAFVWRDPSSNAGPSAVDHILSAACEAARNLRAYTGPALPNLSDLLRERKRRNASHHDGGKAGALEVGGACLLA